MRASTLQHGVEPARRRLDVIVDQHQQIATGSVNAGVSGLVEASMLSQRHQLNRITAGDPLHAGIMTIADHNLLSARSLCLRHNRVQGHRARDHAPRGQRECRPILPL